MLEKSIHDILNAGLGLFKAGEENFKSAFVDLEKTFEELKKRGNEDNSEVAVKIREVLDNTIKGIKEVSDRTESSFSQVMSEVQKNYEQILEQIKRLVGEERIRDLNSKLEELTEYIKGTAGAGAKSGTEKPTAAAGSENRN